MSRLWRSRYPLRPALTCENIDARLTLKVETRVRFPVGAAKWSSPMVAFGITEVVASAWMTSNESIRVCRQARRQLIVDDLRAP